MLVKNLSFLLVALIASKKTLLFIDVSLIVLLQLLSQRGIDPLENSSINHQESQLNSKKGICILPPHHKITFVLFSGFMVKDIGCCCSPVDIKRQCQEINAQIKKVPDHRQVEHRWQRFPTRMRIFHFLNYNLKVQLKEMLHLQFFINRTHLGQ